MKLFCVGLGWLGKLVQETAEKKGVRMNGTTTNGRDETTPWKIGDAVPKEVNGCSVLVSIPASKWANHQLTQFLEQLTRFEVSHLVWVSSSGVFTQLGEHDETSKPFKGVGERSDRLIAQEELVKKYFPNAAIIRLVGLFGYDRHPARYFTERSIPNPDAKANMIHGADAAKVCFNALTARWKGVIHGVPPELPSRKLFYVQAFRYLELGTPTFEEENNAKTIVSKRLGNELIIDWSYSNPIHAYEVENRDQHT